MKYLNNLIAALINSKTIKRKHPKSRIIVLDNNFNTFEQIANCLEK